MKRPRTEWHRLTRIDPEELTALCSRCGPTNIRTNGKRKDNFICPGARTKGEINRYKTIEDRIREVETLKTWKQRRREEFRKLKESLCQDCKTQWPHYVMQFDHRPGTVKLFNIGSQWQNVSWQNLLDEVDKCDLICCNCHSMRTWNRRFPEGDE